MRQGWLADAGRVGGGLYAFALCGVTLAAAGLAALLWRQPLLFPSLGPTVMLFFETPTKRSAAPRSAVVGHGVALLAGLGCLVALGLRDHPSAVQEGMTGTRVVAAALSVAVTALVLKLLGTPHPPAGRRRSSSASASSRRRRSCCPSSQASSSSPSSPSPSTAPSA